MIDSIRARNVWGPVALVEVRVMMAVTMSIFETLFVLHGVRGDCSGFGSSCAQCCGFCFWWKTWKWQRLSVNMLATEHYLHAKCLVQVAHPWHLWKHCGHCFICWRDCPCKWSRRPRRPMPWKFGCRSCVALLWPGAVNGSRGPWKKFPHWSFAKWQVLGMLAVDRTRSGSRLESCALDCWKSWHPPTQVGCYMVQCCRMSAVLWLRCVACCWPVGSCIVCQSGRTSRRSCFTRCWVAPSCPAGNIKRWASRPGCCGWCGDTIQQEVAHCSRAAQRVDGNLGAPNGGWVRQNMGFNRTCIFDRSWMFVAWCNVVGWVFFLVVALCWML